MFTVPKEAQYNLEFYIFFSEACLLFFSYIYQVCGSKVSQGHGMILITAGSGELRDLCVFLNERIEKP